MNHESKKEEGMGRPEAFAEIVTRDKKMLSIFRSIEAVAKTSEPVLITGETGVGKELLAKAIHRLSGLKGRFVAINVAGLDDNVFSDTLFGHIKGAYTGADQVRGGLLERSAGGTLLLDEIGYLSIPSQVKLLRLLQEGEYMPLGCDEIKRTDARIVSTTNVDLWAFKRAGKFREDLNFRLRTHHINIPPLRERLEDIPILVDHFLDSAARTLSKKTPRAPMELIKLLSHYSFPGNVRELQSMVFDAVSRHRSKILSLEVFRYHMAQNQGDLVRPIEPAPKEISAITYSGKFPTIKQMSQMLVTEAMKRAKGNKANAAAMLGISRQALSKRLKKLDRDFDAGDS